jgi:LysR family transcriptional regulator, regulator for bpeEF and oprC
MTSFARAVETGSFSAAARDLGIGQPNISRYIAALEEHLGTRLLHRSTRKLVLTQEGERYYAEVRQVLDAVMEAESTARGEGKPSGLLRVTCPSSLGRLHLLPRVGALLSQYPEMELDLQISDRYVNLIDEGVDLAIRIGALQDSSLRARRIGVSTRICVASVDYLARHGEPADPDDLLNHNCIVYTLLSTGSGWTFRDREIIVNGRFRVNTPDGIYGAVVEGLGIGFGPFWMFEDQLRAGKVRMLLTRYLAPPVPINIVYAAKRLLPQRASVFMDFMAAEVGKIPALSEVGLVRLMSEMGGVDGAGAIGEAHTPGR